MYRATSGSLLAWSIGPTEKDEPAPEDLSRGDILVVVDSYMLEVVPTFSCPAANKRFLAVAFVCKYGLKDCGANEFYAHTELLGGTIG